MALRTRLSMVLVLMGAPLLETQDETRGLLGFLEAMGVREVRSTVELGDPLRVHGELVLDVARLGEEERRLFAHPAAPSRSLAGVAALCPADVSAWLSSPAGVLPQSFLSASRALSRRSFARSRT